MCTSALNVYYAVSSGKYEIFCVYCVMSSVHCEVLSVYYAVLSMHCVEFSVNYKVFILLRAQRALSSVPCLV